MPNTPDFTWLFLKMILGLVFVLGLAIVLMKYILPKTRFGNYGSQKLAKAVEILGTVTLEPKKNLYVVRIASRYLVLGVTENSIQTVTELTPSEGDSLGLS